MTPTPEQQERIDAVVQHWAPKLKEALDLTQLDDAKRSELLQRMLEFGFGERHLILQGFQKEGVPDRLRQALVAAVHRRVDAAKDAGVPQNKPPAWSEKFHYWKMHLKSLAHFEDLDAPLSGALIADMLEFAPALHKDICADLELAGIKKDVCEQIAEAACGALMERDEKARMKDFDRTTIVYIGEAERYALRSPNGSFDIKVLYAEKAVPKMLKDQLPTYMTVKLLKAAAHLVVDTVEFAPGEPEFFTNEAGKRCLNTYKPNAIVPAKGGWPTIAKIWEVITNYDTNGQLWLFNWAAAKVQMPAVRSMTAPNFSGPPGVGKTLAGELIGQCVGVWAEIKGTDLADDFNSHWAGSPFVVADEVGDDVREISGKMKPLITDKFVTFKVPHAARISIKNVMSFWISSNKTSSLKIEKHDRRYTLFAIPDSAATPEQQALCESLFDLKTKELTPVGLVERAAFLYDLQNWEVDWRAAKTPYRNEAKADREAATRNAHETFFDRIDEGLFEEMKNAYLETLDARIPYSPDKDNPGKSTETPRYKEALKFNVAQDCPSWGMSCDQVYAVYKHFAKTLGSAPPKAETSFGLEWKRRYGDRWLHVRRTVNPRVYVYGGFDGLSAEQYAANQAAKAKFEADQQAAAALKKKQQKEAAQSGAQVIDIAAAQAARNLKGEESQSSPREEPQGWHCVRSFYAPDEPELFDDYVPTAEELDA